MTAEKTLLTDVLELIDAWEGGIRTGDPDRGVNGDADKELAALAKVRAHIKQLERRCAELEAENRKWKREHKAMSKGAQTNAAVAKSLCGKLADSKDELAQMKSELAELRRDRERLDLVLKLLRFGGTEALRKRIHWGYPGPYREDIDAAIRDSRNGNASGEASPPADGYTNEEIKI